MEIIRTFEHRDKTIQLAAFEPTETPRASIAPSRPAPGAGKCEITGLSLSSEKISSGDTLTLHAQIQGERIAYLYTEILFADPETHQFYGPITRDTVRAENDQETGGVMRPVWGQTTEFNLTLTPMLPLLTDGVHFAFAFCLPEGYARTNQLLEGIYTSADGSIRRRARITLDGSGDIQGMLAYKDQAGRSAPHALRLQPDDRFSPFVQVLAPPDGENSAWQAGKCLSGPLVFRDRPFHRIFETLLPGEYLAGVLIQDLDGKFTRQYVPFKGVGG
jgi:hypothetical protein